MRIELRIDVDEYENEEYYQQTINYLKQTIELLENAKKNCREVLNKK